MVIIIIGDIHGNFKTLIALLESIPQSERDKGVVLCGDLIDRGPKSMQIVQWCIDNNIQTVKGNHEQMMVDDSESIQSEIRRLGYIPPQGRGSLWTLNGGYEALRSYEIPYDSEEECRANGYPPNRFDFKTFQKHVDWMKTLPLYLEFPEVKGEDGRYLVVSHSNIGNVWKYRNEPEDNNSLHSFSQNVMWGRPTTIKDVKEIYNVIGHTPQEFGARVKNNYANVDTGCFYKKGGFGILTALQFPEMIIYEHNNIDSSYDVSVEKSVLTLEELKIRKRRNK